MSTAWKQSSVVALRILHWRWKTVCASLHHVEVEGKGLTGFASLYHGAAPFRRFMSDTGIVHSHSHMKPGWMSGNGGFHRYCSLAASDLELDAVVEGDFSFTEADRQASCEFLRTFGVKEEKLAKLVEKCPAVLCRSFKDDIQSLLQTLKEVGVPEQLACRILEKNPNLMIRILERNLFGENLAYLLQCGLSVRQLERVVRIYPQSLGASIELQLQPTVEFLMRLGVTKEKIGKVLSLSPYYLGYRHDISLLPKVAFLMSIGVKRENLGKIIMEQPSMLCLSISENIMPKLKYLESVGVERGRLGEIISRYPAMLTSSMDTMKVKVEYFGSKGLDGKNLVNLLTLHPDLLGRSLDSLNLGFANLQSIGFTQDEVCAILKSHPTVLGSTETHLRRKFDFLTMVMNRSLKEVLKFTAFVTYSLEKRIKPRHRVFTWLVSQGLLPRKNYSLRTIIGGSEEYFQNRFVSLHPSAEAVYKELSEAKVQKLRNRGTTILLEDPQTLLGVISRARLKGGGRNLKISEAGT